MRVYDAKIVYRLVSRGRRTRLNTPARIAAYLRSAFATNPMQEMFYAVYVDRQGHPICRHLISLGTLTSTIVGPREIFRGAILAGAAGLIISHNHPSGNPSPSSADTRMTMVLREAANLLDFDLLDHVIIGTPEADPTKRGWFSFRHSGLL